MSGQLHKRLSKSFVEEVLKAFDDRRSRKKKACAILEVRRSRFYELRKRWLRCILAKRSFDLWGRRESAFHCFLSEEERYLHEEFTFIRRKAGVHWDRFSFAMLA